MNKCLMSLIVAVPCVFCLAADDKPAAGGADAPAAAAGQRKPVEMNDLEKQFEKTMTGATLVGRSSIIGDEDKVPAEDRYEISKVTKIGEDLWLFTARIGNAKVPVPLPVPVKWAGDTPVISVTKLTVPTRGTFNARVVIYADHYAGTWDGGDHAGYLWGRVERTKDAAAKDQPKP